MFTCNLIEQDNYYESFVIITLIIINKNHMMKNLYLLFVVFRVMNLVSEAWTDLLTQQETWLGAVMAGGLEPR